MYIITNFESSPTDIAQRPAIVLTARVHPGYHDHSHPISSEANGSFVIEGIVKYLIGEAKEARELRDAYVIKVR